MEFIPRPRESNLAALIAQMQANQSAPIAQGILQAGQGIGQGIQSGFATAQAAGAKRDALMALLAEKGLLSQGQPGIPTGTVRNGQKVWDNGVPLDMAFPGAGFQPGSGLGLRQGIGKSDHVTINQEMLANYPGLQKSGYKIGDSVPNAVFNAQTKPTELTPQERKLAASKLGIKPEDLQGVSSDIVKSLVPSVFFDPNTKRTVSGPPGAKLLPTPEGEKPLSGEISNRKTLAEDGLENISYIESEIAKPEAWSLIVKAGGSFKRLKSLGDPAAEKLVNAIYQAGDAESRLKTGAAMKESEEEMYLNKLIQTTGTMEGNKDRIARKRSYFERELGNLGIGRGKGKSAGGVDALIDKHLGAKN